MQQLSGLDAMFVHMERSSTFMHIGPVMIYQPTGAQSGANRFTEIKAIFERRLHLSSVFRRKMVTVPLDLDRPYWVEDPDFKLRHHVHRRRLPAPADWQEFFAVLGKLHASPLNRSRPLWEAHLIEGLDNLEGLAPGCFAIYLKTHHATQDGATGVKIVEAIHDLEPGASEKSSDDTWKAEPDPGNLDLLGRAVVNNLRQPLKLARVVRQAVPAMRHLLDKKNTDHDRDILLSERIRFNGPLSTRRAVGSITLQLQELQEIKRTVRGATINDVSLAIISGAMRKYLESTGESPGVPLIAGVPVNARQDEQKGSNANVLSMMRMSLCSDVDDPALRLHDIHRESARAKASNDAMGADLMTDLAESLPDYLVAWASKALYASGLLSKMDPFLHTVVTNVPGPRMPLYLGDAQMVQIIGLGPCLDSIGLFHTVSSYCEVFTLAFQACRKMLPDPDSYTLCLQQSLDELKASTLPKPKRKRKPRRTRKKATT